jgi:hypothetical protein
LVYDQVDMQAAAFWKVVTVDHTDLLGRFTAFMDRHGVRYCLIGGQAVNAYVEPLVSLDLDVAVAARDLTLIEPLLRTEFKIERFPHSLNAAVEGSDLRIQIQTDPRYADFPDRAVTKPVLGRTFPVAAIEDVLRGKVWAASDETQRPSKRQKDLADIARLLESDPRLRDLVPADLLARLI